ncbi:MAG: hypothetical protein M9945_12495 [Aquamicrobium sp.]|uniref:hypothetical protein n=1 Tax=Aquamicrobium sp. TaxID=1872579 RepID=UPI00349E6276|nr:hypothetical protein [Aquamicrobium sp.]
MIPSIRYEDCWLVGDTLMSRKTLDRYDLVFSPSSERPVEDHFDCVDGGGIQLCVTHIGFSGHVRVLEFINQIVAQRFDLPTRYVRVEYINPGDGLLKRDPESAHDAFQFLLSSGPVHFVIPRSVWIEYRAKHAAEMVRREECWRSPAPQEKGGE